MMTEKQLSDYHKLRSYYPYRMFFLVQLHGEDEATVWAMRDRREINKAIRNGATVSQIEALP